MNWRIVRSITKVTLLAVMLGATLLFASAANAQSEYQGKFTLPFEARWGQAVLPAGQYWLTCVHFNPGTVLVIRDANNRRIVAYESAVFREDSATGESALLVGKQGKQRAVHSARIAELGAVFVYDPELARGQAVEEAHKTQVVPVIVAKK